MKHSSGAKTPEAEPQAKSTAVPSLSATAKFVLLFIAAASVAVIAAQLSGHPVVNFRAILDYRDNWKNWASMNPVAAIFAFLALYTAFAAFSLPGAAALTLLGGSLFGLVTGTLVVSLASVAGATTAMLISRYLLRELVDRKFANAMARINRGMEKDGAAYLFGLRLVPVVPFFAVNLAMGLTQIRPWTFAWVSQLGMLPATVVYVNAGSQLMSVDSAAGLLNWRLLLAFAALAALPFAAKASASWWARHRLYAKWPRPKRAEYNMVVIGAGSAGLVSSYIAATAKARVALIEQFEMGGDCLNTGCVPSKALIRSAKLASESRKAAQFGLKGSLDVDFPAVMHRVRRVIEKVAPHDSSERYRGLGVDVISGRARVTSPWTVVVGDRTLTTRKVIIATGAEPILPPIPGLDDLRPLTSETIWSLTEQPMTLLVVGGGAIGCELAQSYARLGSRVILIQSSERLLPREDPEIGEAMRGILASEGIELHLGAEIARFDYHDGHSEVYLADGGSITFDKVLVATGRRPRTTGFGLEELGLLEGERLVVDGNLRSRLPNIFAAGDVIGGLQFTHAASHYAWFASINALFGRLKTWRVNVDVFPIVIYTDPEVARVGLTEGEARQRGIRYETTTYELKELDRAIADEADHGFIKVLTPPGKDRILGVTIVGSRAGDMLAEFTLAMRHGLGLGAILRTIHAYPGWMEANKAVAGEWRRAHAPKWALELSERWLRFQRG